MEAERLNGGLLVDESIMHAWASIPNTAPTASPTLQLGVVDASTKDRLGAGQGLLAVAKEVHVFDHHAMKQPDIEATRLHLEDVGSVTTMVVERLREESVEVTDAEATLLAIDIHADTGSMTYDCTTVRDVEALAWVMRRGARQPVIAEFCHQRLTRDQQQFLSESFLRLNTTLHDGTNIGTGGYAARAQPASQPASQPAGQRACLVYACMYVV